MDGFNDDIGEPRRDSGPLLDRRAFYLWEDREPASMVAHTDPVEGVVRIQYVYTPREKRRHGYAGACVAALSKHLTDAGHRCALYTDLGNPVSNSIYRRIGYRAVAEALRYTLPHSR
jgi:predicted GNAT family acetyltransferase